MGIISVISVISSNLLTRTYRTSSDAELISKLRQNGAVASDALGEAIRMADSVVCFGNDGTVKNRIVIRTFAGKYLMFRFVDGYIAKQENLDPASLPDPQYPSGFCTQTPDTSQEVMITDNDPDSGVSIEDGEFKQLPGREGKDTVTIKFDVKPAGNQTGASGIVNIQTTVQVR